ncbi:MAG: hypothetical protein H7Y00_08825 [Fimbriimonadaceae bacterium]|nr:hypothetical protein [Chitinophagales bacterium]
MQELGSGIESMEPLFDNITVKFYNKTFTLRRTVKIKKDITLVGYIECMTCDDRQCTAEYYDFKFDLIANKSTN